MKCHFPARVMLDAMQATFATFSSRARNTALRELVLEGLEAVDSGVSLRSRVVQLGGVGQSTRTLAVLVPEGSPLALGLQRLEASQAMGYGELFVLLANLGWERINARQDSRVQESVS